MKRNKTQRHESAELAAELMRRLKKEKDVVLLVRINSRPQDCLQKWMTDTMSRRRFFESFLKKQQSSIAAALS